jgi:hypothetical protein
VFPSVRASSSGGDAAPKLSAAERREKLSSYRLELEEFSTAATAANGSPTKRRKLKEKPADKVNSPALQQHAGNKDIESGVVASDVQVVFDKNDRVVTKNLTLASVLSIDWSIR